MSPLTPLDLPRLLTGSPTTPTAAIAPLTDGRVQVGDRTVVPFSGLVVADGAIDTSTPTPDQTGGAIALLGDAVILTPGAIQQTGPAGSGVLTLGWQDPLVNQVTPRNDPPPDSSSLPLDNSTQPPPNGGITIAPPPADGTQPPPDGTQPLPDGTQPLPDGSQLPPDGTQPLPDGTRPLPDGTQPLPDGSQLPPDGTQPPPDGTQPLPDGSQLPPDGTQPPPDGTQPLPDGSQLPPDGTQPPPDGSQPLPNGSQLPLDGTQPPPDGSQPLPDENQLRPDGTQPPPNGSQSSLEDDPQPPPNDGDQPPSRAEQLSPQGQAPLPLGQGLTTTEQQRIREVSPNLNQNTVVGLGDAVSQSPPPPRSVIAAVNPGAIAPSALQDLNPGIHADFRLDMAGLDPRMGQPSPLATQPHSLNQPNSLNQPHSLNQPNSLTQPNSLNQPHSLNQPNPLNPPDVHNPPSAMRPVARSGRNPNPQNPHQLPDSATPRPNTPPALTPVNFPPNLELSGVTDLLQQGDIKGGLGQVEIQWSRQYTDFWGSQANAEMHDAAGIRQMLVEIAQQTGQRTALIYAIANPNRLDLIVQTGTGAPIYHHVDVDRTTLLTTARALRTTITNPLLQSSDQYLEPAQQLYQWLVAPLLPDLEAAQIKTLLFSPDGGLRSLPLAALHDGQQFLIERFGVGMTPSMNLTDTRYAPLANASVLAMGASEFEILDPLPAVPVELQAITTQASSGIMLLNEQFTVANLRQERSHNPFQVVHLATHGDFQASHPNAAFIQFWGSEQLTLDRLRELGLGRPQVDLLVLSACRTAVGNFEAELGFAGLAVQSGVKSVLASLWSVDDEGTLALMNEFYRQLRQTSTKAEALRQAQLTLLHGQVRIESGYLADTVRGQQLALPSTRGTGDRTLAHPYYWSAFTLIGSPW